MNNQVILSDNLAALKNIPDESVNLIFIDPPYNKGFKRIGIKTITERNEIGVTGFGGNKYIREEIITQSYEDDYGDSYISFMKERIVEAYRILKNNGSFYLIADYSEIHYLKVMCDGIFGRENYRGSVYWNWDFGAKATKNYPNKVNEILYYVKGDNFTWNYLQLPTIPYMSKGGLIPKEKLERGKRLTNCWFISIEGTNSKERKLYSYPTMKPQKLLSHIITASSNEGDICLDFFAGGGSFGQACFDKNRKFIMIDSNIEAYNVMKKRFENQDVEFINLSSQD